MRLNIQLFGGRGASSSRVGGSRSFDGSTTLSGVGSVPGYNASNIKKGDILMFNYGYTSKVENVVPSKTGKSVSITTRSSISGEKFTKTYRSNQLLAVAKQEAKSDKAARINEVRGRFGGL